MNSYLFEARFDDCAVIRTDDPRFFEMLPYADLDVRMRAYQWANAHGFSLLTGVAGSCPHVLMNAVEVETLRSLEDFTVEDSTDDVFTISPSASLRLWDHMVSGLAGVNNSVCAFHESLAHASFWINNQYPTDPLMLWFPYQDPADDFPVGTAYINILIDQDFDVLGGVQITVSPPDAARVTANDPFVQSPTNWLDNWYSPRSYRVEARTGGPLGGHERLMLKSAWQHAEVLAALRSRSVPPVQHASP